MSDCQHCYCIEVKPDTSAVIQRGRTRTHKKCCNCGNMQVIQGML